MANQIGAIREGLRYQDLYSWCEILLLLDEETPYEKAILEHPRALSVDDLTLYARAGSGKATRYVQLKWRVDKKEACSLESLTRSRNRGPSWLQKLHTSWKALRKEGPAEIFLVSNWPVGDDLKEFVRSREDRFSDNIFDSTSTRAGRARSQLTKHLEISDSDLREFFRDFHLQAGSPSIKWLEDFADERMLRLGLRRGPNIRAIALDQIGSWIERGGEHKIITGEHLRRFITYRGLIAGQEPVEATSSEERIVRTKPDASLWVHGWAKQAFDVHPTEELDWTGYLDYSSRTAPTPETWTNTLFPQLEEVKRRFTTLGEFIDFRGKLPLTALLAIGFVFPEVGGYVFRTTQTTYGETFLWRSNQKPTNRRFISHTTEERSGHDVMLILSVVGNALPDTEALRTRLQPNLRAVIHVHPDDGWGGDSVRSGGDATALAYHAKELLKELRAKYRPEKIHLVVYTPAALALFIGQRLNAVGTIVTYELTRDHDYQTSVILETR